MHIEFGYRNNCFNYSQFHKHVCKFKFHQMYCNVFFFVVCFIQFLIRYNNKYMYNIFNFSSKYFLKKESNLLLFHYYGGSTFKRQPLNFCVMYLYTYVYIEYTVIHIISKVPAHHIYLKTIVGFTYDMKKFFILNLFLWFILCFIKLF